MKNRPFSCLYAVLLLRWREPCGNPCCWLSGSARVSPTKEGCDSSRKQRRLYIDLVCLDSHPVFPLTPSSPTSSPPLANVLPIHLREHSERLLRTQVHHHILHPTLEHIKDNTLDLSNLVDGVVQLFDNGEVNATERGQAKCAAKVYLAIIYAFGKRGFTQIAHAPHLWLEVWTSGYGGKLV